MAKRRSYSVKNVGRKGMSAAGRRDTARFGKSIFVSNTLAGAMTRAHSDVPGRRKSVLKFMPAVTKTPAGFLEGIGKFKYRRKTASFEGIGFRPTYRPRHGRG